MRRTRPLPPRRILERDSKRQSAHPVNFRCHAPGAKEVALIGDFNGWDPETHPMKRQVDGTWQIQLPLAHGHYHYLFWVDGALMLDPRAQGTADAQDNQKVSVIGVS